MNVQMNDLRESLQIKTPFFCKSAVEARSMFSRGLGVALFLLVTSIGCRPSAPNAEPIGAGPAPVADPSEPPRRPKGRIEFRILDFTVQ